MRYVGIDIGSTATKVAVMAHAEEAQVDGEAQQEDAGVFAEGEGAGAAAGADDVSLRPADETSAAPQAQTAGERLRLEHEGVSAAQLQGGASNPVGCEGSGAAQAQGCAPGPMAREVAGASQPQASGADDVPVRPAGETSATPQGQPAGERLSLERTFLIPTGYSAGDAAERALVLLEGEAGLARGDFACVATGYGRVCVPYADKAVTEIACHGRGAAYLFGPEGLVVDVGGQDTKVMHVQAGAVKRFVMNDKCSAGTGRFLEVMADRLGLTQAQLADLVAQGQPTVISNMCTVFAESEVVSLVGKGEPRPNIAHGVIDSVVKRVASLAAQLACPPDVPRYLTGGLCDNAYFVACLGEALGCTLTTCPNARFAGAIGAAVSAARL